MQKSLYFFEIILVISPCLYRPLYLSALRQTQEGQTTHFSPLVSQGLGDWKSKRQVIYLSLSPERPDLVYIWGLSCPHPFLCSLVSSLLCPIRSATPDSGRTLSFC